MRNYRDTENKLWMLFHYPQMLTGYEKFVLITAIVIVGVIGLTCCNWLIGAAQ